MYTHRTGKGPEGRKGLDKPTESQEMTGRGQKASISANQQGAATRTPTRLRQSTLEQAGFGGSGGQDGATAIAPRRFHHGALPVNLLGSLRGDRTSPVSGSSPSAPGTGMASHETRLARIHPSAVEDHIVPKVGCRIEGSFGSHHTGPGQQQALGLQAMAEPDLFPYKKWNATHRALENIPDRAPLTLKEVLTILTLLNEAIILVTQEAVLVNYHANRRLQEEMAGPTVTFSLVLGLREPKSFRMWSILETLQSNASGHNWRSQ